MSESEPRSSNDAAKPKSTEIATEQTASIGSAHTGSRASRTIGIAALVAVGLLAAFGLWISPPEVSQADAARLMYVHLPSIATMYLMFFITLVGSIIYLRNGSRFWDLLAGAAAEIGVVFNGLTLFSGAIWGKPTWGAYWTWDPRVTSTTVMFVMYIGYLAVRRLELPPEARSRRAAVLGILSFLNVIVVHYSVKWWRGLHQGQTIGIDTKLDGLMLTSLMIGFVAFALTGAWLLMHRFRIEWLQSQIGEVGLDQALAERRAEAAGYNPSDSVGGLA